MHQNQKKDTTEKKRNKAARRAEAGARRAAERAGMRFAPSPRSTPPKGGNYGKNGESRHLAKVARRSRRARGEEPKPKFRGMGAFVSSR
ncbi:MAG: hypothetical protein HYS74_00575 [Parcubacteria group bacterium]|nr:hypothetical protein [Parcubacteria group bacterium]